MYKLLNDSKGTTRTIYIHENAILLNNYLRFKNKNTEGLGALLNKLVEDYLTQNPTVFEAYQEYLNTGKTDFDISFPVIKKEESTNLINRNTGKTVKTRMYLSENLDSFLSFFQNEVTLNLKETGQGSRIIGIGRIIETFISKYYDSNKDLQREFMLYKRIQER